MLANHIQSDTGVSEECRGSAWSSRNVNLQAVLSSSGFTATETMTFFLSASAIASSFRMQPSRGVKL